MTDPERCVPLVDDDGEVVASIRMSGDMGEERRRAFLALVAASRRLHEAEMERDPGIALRQAAAVARNRERLRRIRGDAQ